MMNMFTGYRRLKGCKGVLAALVAFVASVSMSEAAVPSGYYQSCEGRGGQSLLSQLCTVVGPHTNIGYDALWDLYKVSDVDNNGKIWDMYSTKRWSTGEKCGSYSAVGSCYNREHSLPKSWFKEASPMKADGHHVYPTDGKVNGQRSNYPYGECANGTTLSAPSGIKALGKLGTSTFAGYSGKVFEPDDEYKGDFARTYFYMAAAYNDKISSWSSDMLAGNSYPVFTTWSINLLLKWHRQDPVSDKEIARNEAVYGRQHNRNPFIDYPEMAEYIWGDKKTEKWYANGSPEPTLSLPVAGTTVDFGTTAVNYGVSRSIPVRGTGLTAPVTLSVSNSEFVLSTQSISAAVANGTNGSVSVTFKGATTGARSATLKLTCGSISRTVNLKVNVVNGIPVMQPSHITAESFVAGWMDLGDEDKYILDVKHAGVSISGYPMQVAAALEEYEVDNLEPETTYTYQISNSTLKSDVMTVTTGHLLPSVGIVADGEIEIKAEPGEPSEAVELWLDVENVTSPITISVTSPFELSTDHLTWSPTVTIEPIEERIYLRVGATAQGTYESVITIRTDDYINDETDVIAVVASNETPWWIETFETLTKDITYSTTTVNGTACVWNVTDVGFFKADNATIGEYSARLGKTSASSLSTSTAKKGGLGTLTLDGCRWSASDGDVTLAVEYSPDGETWHSAGDIQLNSDSYATHQVVINAQGNNYLRLRQTAGKRGNIDNIRVSDYTSGVDVTERDCDWDAYCTDHQLVIVNNDADAVYTVYNIEGMTLMSRALSVGPHRLNVTPGVYFVADGNIARRVLVK